jgi:3-hydroxyacyl-CoA dehydrogenase / enoyl-CoA hydratase / 3-hydroxybutyryl-CoA epimerase
MNTLVLDPTQDPDQDSPPVRRIHERKTAESRPAFRLETDDQGIAWLTFDSPGSKANIWNADTLRDFDKHLEIVGEDASIHALVIRSAKDSIFIAGADLKSLRAQTPAKADELLSLGQDVFNHLAALPVPKIALIHGACVGGGYEMALACDLRIASDADVKKVGLPETQLGLIPGWGGCTRLPRLVGLPNALDVILAGKVLNVRAAKKLGLVDEVVPREHLEAAAKKWCKLPACPKRKEPKLSIFPLIRHLIRWKARRELLAKTRGLYAAPLAALDVISRGIGKSPNESLSFEREAISALARSEETARLIDLFFRKEEASKKPSSAGHATPVREAVVIGAGVMGAGIAHWLVSRGVRALITDVNAEAVAAGVKRVQSLLNEGVRRHSLTTKQARDALDRLSHAHTGVPLCRYPLVIEAATENMELKKKIFADLAKRCAPDAILATNTSALSVTDLAKAVLNPERVIGLHFFNPVHRMPLIEIITHPGSSDDAIATAAAFVQHLGKTPVIVKDSPGFVVNRVLMPYLMEAVRLHESGVPADMIDEAMLEFGMPMGPLRLLDEIGLDVASHVGKTLTAAFPDRFPFTESLDRMISLGKLGKKSGEGFYKHTGYRARPDYHHAHDTARLAEIQQRLALVLANEAARCVDENLARTPTDIDLAMVLGTGYPPFRGGPLAWIESYGKANVAAELRALASESVTPHPFDPASWLTREDKKHN